MKRGLVPGISVLCLLLAGRASGEATVPAAPVAPIAGAAKEKYELAIFRPLNDSTGSGAYISPKTGSLGHMERTPGDDAYKLIKVGDEAFLVYNLADATQPPAQTGGQAVGEKPHQKYVLRNAEGLALTANTAEENIHMAPYQPNEPTQQWHLVFQQSTQTVRFVSLWNMSLCITQIYLKSLNSVGMAQTRYENSRLGLRQCLKTNDRQEFTLEVLKEDTVDKSIQSLGSGDNETGELNAEVKTIIVGLEEQLSQLGAKLDTLLSITQGGAAGIPVLPTNDMTPGTPVVPGQAPPVPVPPVLGATAVAVQPPAVQPPAVQSATVQPATVQPATVQPAAVQPATVQPAAVQPPTLPPAAPIVPGPGGPPPVAMMGPPPLLAGSLPPPMPMPMYGPGKGFYPRYPEMPPPPYGGDLNPNMGHYPPPPYFPPDRTDRRFHSSRFDEGRRG